MGVFLVMLWLILFGYFIITLIVFLFGLWVNCVAYRNSSYTHFDVWLEMRGNLHIWIIAAIIWPISLIGLILGIIILIPSIRILKHFNIDYKKLIKDL